MKNLENHNKNWKKFFEAEKDLLGKVFGNNFSDIQHIGSTAINGILFKPIIDIAILLKSFDKAESFFNKLEKVGYKYFKEKSSSERYFFIKYNSVKFHLSIANPDTSYFERQILFRNYLNKHPKKRKEYEELKVDLLNKYQVEDDRYSLGKSDFVNDVLEKAKK